MSAPLSKEQKWKLVKLSEAVYSAQGHAAVAAGKSWDWSRAAYEEFRHKEVAKAVKRDGLRCCDQDDYMRVKAHFLELQKEHGQAFEAHMRDMSNPKRVWWHKLHEVISQAAAVGITREYARTICRYQCKCELEDASWQQLQKLFFTVRNRMNARVLADGHAKKAKL